MKRLILLFALSLSLISCGIMGIHFKDHNPRKAGKYPIFSNETIILGSLTPIRQNFNATFYDLDININPNDKSIGGWVEIRAIALTDIDSLQLDLDKHLFIDELRWKTRDGLNIGYSRNYGAVLVKLPQTIRKDTLFSLHVKYHGKPIVSRKPPWVGGLVWKKDKQKNNWIGVVCETEGASIWFPCKDLNSDKPDSAHMRFTIPDTSLFVVSNGVFMGSEIKDHSKSFNWKVSYPINLYNITFYVGNFTKIEDSLKGINGKELKLNHYVLKPHAEKAIIHFKQVKEHIKVYEEIYGEYPWYNDGFKLVESPYAGMEHQTAIAYGNKYKNDYHQEYDYIILHETGHEWFGNAVTAADLADVWIQEGITTYGEYLYLEKEYNANVALAHLLVYRLFIKNERPLVGPTERRYFDYHDGDVYVKGAWMMHTLRNNINNDSLFFTIIKTFYNENKLKVTNSNAFIETVNRITGKDYKWFFNQYLYNNKVPFLEYQFCSDGTLYYRWVDVSEEFNKLRVLLNFEENEKKFEIYPNIYVQKLKFPKELNQSSPVFNKQKALFGTKRNKRLRGMYEKQISGKQSN